MAPHQGCIYLQMNSTRFCQGDGPSALENSRRALWDVSSGFGRVLYEGASFPHSQELGLPEKLRGKKGDHWEEVGQKQSRVRM